MIKEEMNYVYEALKMAKKAYNSGEVPVGAVIVKNNKIISKGYNKKEKSGIAIDHAEIVAIRKACKVEKNWRLDDCSIYVTLKPCLMCMGAINEARIKKVFYVANRDKSKTIKFLSKVKKINEETISKQVVNLMKNFFKNRRDK